MALVRKYQKAGGIEGPKKVLTYENVGTYDAEKLASSLTQSIESYVDELGLGAKDRQSFLKLGASMINAIKDGNVIKNTDGTFTINGQYGLNNTFSNVDVQRKIVDDEVGRGATPYEGEYQKSHGIFTTQETEDFRRRNHILGLVGQWVNSVIKTQTTLESATKEEAKSTPFDFEKFFASKEYGGLPSNKKSWGELYTTSSERLNRLSEVLGSLTDENYQQWAKTNTNIGTPEEIKNTVLNIREDIKNGDEKEAKRKGLKLGLSFSRILGLTSTNGGGTGSSEGTQIDQENEATVRANLIARGFTEEQADSYIQQAKEAQVLSELNEKAKAVRSLLDEYWKSQVEYDRNEPRWSAQNDINQENLIGTDGNSMRGFAEAIEYAYKNYVDNVDQLSNEDSINFGKLLEHYGDMYEYLKKQKDQRSIDIFNALYESLSKYSTITPELSGFIRFNGLSTDTYSIIYDPKSKIAYRILNSLLTGTSQYDKAKQIFTENFRKRYFPSKKQGGILKAQGGAILNGFITDSPTVATEQPEEQKEAEEENQGTDLMELWDKAPNHEKVRAVSALLDFAALIGSMAGFGPTSAGLGVTSTLANLGADLADDNVGAKRTAVNLATGLLTDALSLFPYTRAARVTTTGQKLVKSLPYIFGGLATYTGYNAVKDLDHYYTVIQHIMDGNYELGDIRAISGLLNAVLGFGANMFTRNAGNQVSEHAIDTPHVRGDDGITYTISPTELQQINAAGNFEDANKSFRTAVSRSTGTPVENVTANLPKQTEHHWKGEPTTKPIVDVSYTTELPPYYTPTNGGRSNKLNTPSRAERNLADNDSPFSLDRLNVVQWMRDKMANPFTLEPGSKVNVTSMDNVFEYKGRLYKKQTDGSYKLFDDPVKEAKELERISEAKSKARKEAIKEGAESVYEGTKNVTKKAASKTAEAAKAAGQGVLKWGKSLNNRMHSKPKLYYGEIKVDPVTNTRIYTHPSGKQYPINEWLDKYRMYKKVTIDPSTVTEQQMKQIIDEIIPSKKQGGSLQFARNLINNYQPKQVPKGFDGFKINTGNGNIIGSQKFFDLFKILDPNATLGDQVSGYQPDNINWVKTMQAMHDQDAKVDTAPQNAGRGRFVNGGGAEAKRIEEDPTYINYTNLFQQRLTDQNLNDDFVNYFKELQNLYRKDNEAFKGYIDDSGNIVTGAAGRYKYLRTDSGTKHADFSQGVHHHNMFDKDTITKYFRNGKEVTDVTGIDLSKLTPEQAWDKEHNYLFYDLSDVADDTGGGSDAQTRATTEEPAKEEPKVDQGKKEQITVATQNGKKDDNSPITSTLNWANPLQWYGLTRLNSKNKLGAKQVKDWEVALEEASQGLRELKGNIEALMTSDAGQSSLANSAGQMFSTRVEEQLGHQRNSKAKGLTLGLQGALADARDFNTSREAIMQQEDQNRLNRQTIANRNRQAISQKDKFDAEVDYALTMQNAQNEDAFIKSIVHQIFERNSDIRQMLKEKTLQDEATRRWLLTRQYEAKLKGLVPGSGDYEAKIKQYTDDLEQALSSSSSYFPMRDILGRRVILTSDVERPKKKKKSDLARKGRKLLPGDDYIMQGAKDYNKAKLQNAREFYKNIRANQRKRK